MTYTKEDLIYLAGIFDGEGCVSAVVTDDGKWNLRIQVINTDGRLMTWLVDLFGGTVYNHKNDKKPNHRSCYTWNLSARKGKQLFIDLLPFLKLKKLQLEALLELLDLMGTRGVQITNLDDRLFLQDIIHDAKWQIHTYTN